VETNAAGASPHNLLATTIADELKLATQGKSRVFAVSFKDRSSILPSGHTTDVAFWIDKASGLWVTSTYYRSEMPAWAAAFNNAGHAKSYLNRQWKDAAGSVLRTTNPGQTWPDGTPLDFYETVGRTPFANDYTLEFTRELIVNEKLGTGPAPDYLSLSISSQDILGHRVGPDSPQIHALLLALDRQLADFFTFLGKQVGLANVWIALSADHGVSPLADVSTQLHIPGGTRDISTLKDDVNVALSAKFSPGKNTEFLVGREFPNFFISEEAFRAAGVQENDAERAVGDALMARLPELRGYFTRYQMRNGGLPQNELGKMMAHSYSDHGGWYVIVQPKPYWVTMTSKKYDPGTDHGLPYNYDQHVPLLLYGVPFVPGTYRGHSEPVDLAPTWASLLGINPPSSSIGRVLTEALRAAGGSQ
jgi:predicted AlkP superfamily pyrophosphatase or phosphodiesterase